MQVENFCQYNMQNKKLLTFEDEDCPAELKDDIKIIIKSEGFTKYDVRMKKIPADGGNYLAKLYEIDITGETAEGKKEIDIFAKQLNLGSGNFNMIIDIPEVYKTEKFAYKELRKIFNELQEDAKIPISERYKMVKCYDSNPGAILMDNLCKQSYKVHSRIEVISLEYAELAVKNLAKFHALSFVIENSMPDFFVSKIKSLKYPVNFGKEWNALKKSTFSVAMCNLEDDLRNRVEDIIFSKLDKYRHYYENAEFSCLCHGDYRVMNLMTRDVDGKIMDIITLDYQTLNCGNPIIDLIHFIFTSTDKKFRKNHLSYIKDTYYQTMKDFSKYFDIDIEKRLPRETFERIYEETLDLGLITIVAAGPIIFADETDVPDLTNISMSNLNFKVHDVYKDLLRDSIEDFIEWGNL